MTDGERQDHAGGLPATLGACALLIALLVIHLHDPLVSLLESTGGHEAARTLTARFTVGFVVLAAISWALALLARRGSRPLAPLRFPGERVLGIVSALACLGLWAVHLAPGRHTFGLLAAVSCVGFALACLALVSGGRSARFAVPVVAATMLLLTTTPVPYQGTPMLPVRDAWFQVIVASTFLFSALACLVRPSPRTVLAGLLVSAVLLRVHGIDHHEIDARHRDMLPLVQYACEAFMDGRNPYALLYWANHDLPLTYLPVMWGSSLWAVVVGADVRWSSILATVVVALVLHRWGAPALRRDAGWLERAIPRAPLPAWTALAAAFLFHPEVFWNALHGEPIVYWFWLVVFLDAVRAERRWRAAVLLGLLLASRHFAVLVVPFASLWLLGTRRRWRPGLLALLLAGAIACLLVVPFFAPHPDSFLYGTYDWLVSYGPSRRTWWDVQIGFQQFFYAGGREAGLRTWQLAAAGAAVAASLAALVWARLARGPGQASRWAVWAPFPLGYAGFVLFNSMIWKSFLLPVLLVVAFAASLAGTGGHGRGREPGPIETALMRHRWYWPAAIALLAPIALSCVVLGTGWHRHRHQEDVAFAARVVAARDLWQGDLLVDWSTVQAGHVRRTSPFADLPLPPGVRRVTRMRAQDLTASRRIVLFDGWSRFDPDRDFPDLERVTSRRMGRSQVHVFRPPRHVPPRAWRLSENPGAVGDVLMLADRPPSFPGRKQGERWVFDHVPPWHFVGPKIMRVAGRPVRLVWAHPAERATLRFRVALPGEGHVVLVTALDDAALRPLFAPVEIRVLPGDDEASSLRFTHPNRQGRWFWDAGFVDEGWVLIEIRTRRQAMRHFGIDLVLDELDAREGQTG